MIRILTFDSDIYYRLLQIERCFLDMAKCSKLSKPCLSATCPVAGNGRDSTQAQSPIAYTFSQFGRRIYSSTMSWPDAPFSQSKLTKQ